MSQQYSLRWNNHQPNFISMFTSLLQTQTLVDVTLAAEGQQMRAHKVVLSACSNYFQSLFVDNPSQHPIVILKDVTFSDLRIIVDFMYYGVVNVSEEQLPQVLETAKTLMIKGLTEMPDSTSLTRSQGTTADFPDLDSQRAAASPGASPSAKRRRRRQSSAGSVQMNAGADESRADEQADLVRDAITLSSVPQQRRARDYDDRAVDAAAQQNEQQSLDLDLDANQAALQQQAAASGVDDRVRRQRLRRQERLQDEWGRLKQASEPAPPTPHHHPATLSKHQSYPQYNAIKSKRARLEAGGGGGSAPIRPVSVAQGSAARRLSTAIDMTVHFESVEQLAPRSRHTPVLRAGPALSCNFCWNTYDESGRILRRKTQYHCPECRTNLCIVPCFHEYHSTLEARHEDQGTIEAGAEASATNPR